MANLITLCRIPLLFLFIFFLYSGNILLSFIAIPLLFFAMSLDMVDGIVARKMNETSLIGSVLDIAVDRVFELLLWFIFADMDLIPIAIPLIVVTRTVLTDSFRSLGIQEGKAPFNQHSSYWANFFVASRWMRAAYGIAKVTAFCGLTLVFVLKLYCFQNIGIIAINQIHAFFTGVSWLAVIFCIVRGLPVLINGFRLAFAKNKNED